LKEEVNEITSGGKTSGENGRNEQVSIRIFRGAYTYKESIQGGRGSNSGQHLKEEEERQ